MKQQAGLDDLGHDPCAPRPIRRAADGWPAVVQRNGDMMAQRTERLRGRAGQEQRRRRLINEPLCRDCADQGRVTASTVPDHIKPLAKGGADTDDNIRCLCGPCHEVRTAEQFVHERRAALGACDATGLPTDPAHPWNRGAP